MELTLVDLVIIFVPIVITTLAMDKIMMVLEDVMASIPKFPDYLERPLSYLILICFNYFFFWVGDFSFFDYFEFSWREGFEWIGYLSTAALATAGSKFLNEGFGLLSMLPGNVSGVTASLRRNRKKTKNDYTDDI